MNPNRVLPPCPVPFTPEHKLCVLSDFRVVSELGRCETSTFHRVIHTTLNRTFTLRMIFKDKLKPEHIAIVVQPVVAALLKLQSLVNVLTLRFYFEDDSKIYLVGDFAHEGRLQDYLAKSRFDPKLVAMVSSSASSVPRARPRQCRRP